MSASCQGTGWVGGGLAWRRGDVREWDRKGAGRWVPRNRLLGRNFNAHDFFFFLSWLESKDDLHLKHHFAITNLTRARPAPSRPTLCFPFPPLLCTCSCLSVSSKKKKMFWLGWKGEIFLLLYIYIKF